MAHAPQKRGGNHPIPHERSIPNLLSVQQQQQKMLFFLPRFLCCVLLCIECLYAHFPIYFSLFFHLFLVNCMPNKGESFFPSVRLYMCVKCEFERKQLYKNGMSELENSALIPLCRVSISHQLIHFPSSSRIFCVRSLSESCTTTNEMFVLRTLRTTEKLVDE